MTPEPPPKSPLCARRRLPSMSLKPECIKENSYTYKEHPRSNIMELAFFTPPQSTAISVPCTVQPLTPQDALEKPKTMLSHSQSASSLSPPQRTIRRKKRMTLLKQKSSRSLRNRASAPLLPKSSDTNYFPSLESSLAMPQVRLGHPSRPYYTAIRPHSMSRPSSPFSTPPASRAPSPSLPLTFTPTNYSNTQSLYQASPVRNSLPTMGSNATIGFSLSGETELRMALARWRSLDGVVQDDQPAEYTFRDIAPETSRGKPKKCVKIGRRVKRLGMEIMELVLGRK